MAGERTIRIIRSETAVHEQYLGRWVAWNRTRSRILATAEGLPDVVAAAQLAGEHDPHIQWDGDRQTIALEGD